MRPEDLSGRHFTDKACRAVEHARDRAVDRGMVSGELTEATAGMLTVLSILRWERTVARAALERTAADLDALARELDAAIDAEGRAARDPGGSRFTALPAGRRGIVVDTAMALRRLLEQAEHEALGLRHNWVGTEHLVLASVRLACPRFWELLDRHRIGYDGLRQAVLDVLQS
jgi:ATP-dependent Clp protease ATP-binding subunit ClpA